MYVWNNTSKDNSGKFTIYPKTRRISHGKKNEDHGW